MRIFLLPPQLSESLNDFGLRITVFLKINPLKFPEFFHFS